MGTVWLGYKQSSWEEMEDKEEDEEGRNGKILEIKHVKSGETIVIEAKVIIIFLGYCKSILHIIHPFVQRNKCYTF